MSNSQLPTGAWETVTQNSQIIDAALRRPEIMKFNALLVVSVLLALGGLFALPGERQAAGLGLDGSWQLAVIHAELALAPLLYLPVVGERRSALNNLLGGASCWAAGGAVVLLFGFAGGAGWSTRALSACVWLAVSGVLAMGARRDAAMVQRGRVLLLALLALPALWHYLLLEYAGATGAHLRAISPNWGLATNQPALWPLLLIGTLCWVGAFALPTRRTT